ncbi:MAG TPA: alpha/beta fold hydrolase [Pyrinomonadaceae bacterium]|nr:alpha/beta fold hydrolase [Pyrinomonadaceae bacterium]
MEAMKAMTLPWISSPRPNPRASVRLFCFPYAGGSAAIYRSWHEGFPQTVEVCPIQLPGRGTRFREKPFTNLTALVGEMAQALLPHFDRPFAFFGHSMGSLISYELARLLREGRAIAPCHLFVSGRSAPHLASRNVTYNLPEDEFIAELRRLNGTPREVIEHPELMKLMIPLMRADFEMCETYSASQGRPLDCPVTAFGGDGDEEVPREEIEAWHRHTTGPFSLHMIPGDHFFLQTSRPRLTHIIARELSKGLIAG